MQNATRADLAVAPDRDAAGQLGLRADAGASLDHAQGANARAGIDLCAGVYHAAGVNARLIRMQALLLAPPLAQASVVEVGVGGDDSVKASQSSFILQLLLTMRQLAWQLLNCCTNCGRAIKLMLPAGALSSGAIALMAMAGAARRSAQ